MIVSFKIFYTKFPSIVNDISTKLSPTIASVQPPLTSLSLSFSFSFLDFTSCHFHSQSLPLIFFLQLSWGFLLYMFYFQIFIRSIFIFSFSGILLRKNTLVPLFLQNVSFILVILRMRHLVTLLIKMVSKKEIQ